MEGLMSLERTRRASGNRNIEIAKDNSIRTSSIIQFLPSDDNYHKYYKNI